MENKKHEEEMTIEQIDQHIEQHESRMKVAKRPEGTAALNFDLCNYFRLARPILKFVRPFLFFKPKWQKILDTVIESGDAACPTS